jgi:tripartite-type tricarboxylate transporter receptor subunit TctC
MELFKGMTGIQASHVSYRGSLPAVTDVAAGHVPMMFCDLGPAAGLLASGKVRPLGISSPFRVPGYPDIPPLAEAGVPGFNAVSWQMIVAPAKTPRPIVDKLNREMGSILATQDAKDQIVKSGFLPIDSPSVEGLVQFVKSESERWGKVVRDAGLAGSL